MIYNIKPMALPKDQQFGLFCIEIDFQKGSESPSRVFRTMTELIETFQAFDNNLVQSIDPSIETVALIEDIESGSIRAWLATVLKVIDDDALKALDWKKQVGKYLVKAKYIAIEYMQGKTEIKNKEEIEQLEQEILQAAIETDVTHIPAYSLPNRQKLISNIDKISKSLTYLNDNDRAVYRTPEKEVEMNKAFNIVPETIQQLLTREVLTSKQEMILKVKKPDYLGDSRWDLRHENKIISVKVKDYEWLDQFQSRQIDVRPGDSLRADVEIKVMYGYDYEVVDSQYDIIRVKEVLRDTTMEQIPLSSPKDDQDKDR
jgi:hypothetical protein